MSLLEVCCATTAPARLTHGETARQRLIARLERPVPRSVDPDADPRRRRRRTPA
ncbi:hypothetical protein trd_A0422 (plasmid) [Thermomicrobium roseum DSM 5159]|uniref:Uncharacterized protein n=1 Tax=Thermomicrobium roseum (strain ATCC 27502 / DSM 5159 / P-2) TaxID=309801 RepID=B9L3Q8_THERP|nr:hypothetical protein trd_A0422 [Thermomicrobium roseum DSM 5159]